MNLHVWHPMAQLVQVVVVDLLFIIVALVFQYVRCDLEQESQRGRPQRVDCEESCPLSLKIVRDKVIFNHYNSLWKTNPYSAATNL